MTERVDYEVRGGGSFKTDDDIDLPNNYVAQKKLLNTFSMMEVDESFFIPELGTINHYNYVFGNACFYEKRYHENFNVAIRFECDDDGVMGLRVWRLPDQERKDKK